MNSVQWGNLALATSTAAVDAGMAMTGQRPVLRIIVENFFYPVILDVLHQIFSKFGTVLKIITFTKNNHFQALLQYANPVSAQRGQAVAGWAEHYNACFPLRMDFSKLTSPTSSTIRTRATITGTQTCPLGTASPQWTRP